MNFRKFRLIIKRRMPRRRQLHGSILHRTLGEKLFDAAIWKFSRKSVAGGLAVGLFVALTPTIGLQMLVAGLAAYVLRVNIPVALIACWVTNPITIPVIYTFQYKLGCLLLGHGWAGKMHKGVGFYHKFMDYAKPLWMGSLLTSLIGAVAGYIAIYAAWPPLERLSRLKKNKEKPSETEREDVNNKEVEEDGPQNSI